MSAFSLWFGVYEGSEIIFMIHCVLGLDKTFSSVWSKCFSGTLFYFQGIYSQLF